MGGGGGRPLIRQGDLDRLSQTAIDALRQASPPSRRSVFISFATEDLDEVNLLRGQAKNEGSALDFIDRSVQVPFNSENAEYIKRRIRERIRQTSVTVVYISQHTHNSDWVDWEIREARRQGKGVIGVYAGDTAPGPIPRALDEMSAQIVPWKHDELSGAIERAASTRE